MLLFGLNCSIIFIKLNYTIIPQPHLVYPRLLPTCLVGKIDVGRFLVAHSLVLQTIKEYFTLCRFKYHFSQNVINTCCNICNKYTALHVETVHDARYDILIFWRESIKQGSLINGVVSYLFLYNRIDII